MRSLIVVSAIQRLASCAKNARVEKDVLMALYSVHYDKLIDWKPIAFED